MKLKVIGLIVTALGTLGGLYLAYLNFQPERPVLDIIKATSSRSSVGEVMNVRIKNTGTRESEEAVVTVDTIGGHSAQPIPNITPNSEVDVSNGPLLLEGDRFVGRLNYKSRVDGRSFSEPLCFVASPVARTFAERIHEPVQLNRCPK